MFNGAIGYRPSVFRVSIHVRIHAGSTMKHDWGRIYNRSNGCRGSSRRRARGERVELALMAGIHSWRPEPQGVCDFTGRSGIRETRLFAEDSNLLPARRFLFGGDRLFESGAFGSYPEFARENWWRAYSHLGSKFEAGSVDIFVLLVFWMVRFSGRSESVIFLLLLDRIPEILSCLSRAINELMIRT